MIKFFRHIRQNLLMENKTGKYLKYAIGEIVLVVIGILIALQINTWNESRKQAISENEFIASVKKDLIQDKAFINVIINHMEPRKEAYKALCIDLPNRYTNARPSLDSLFQKYFVSQRTFYPISGSYESAVSGNQINTFSNKALLQDIVKIYNSTYDRLIDNGQIIDGRWFFISKKYSYERRTGNFRDMNPEQLSEFLDDLYHHYVQMEWYLEMLNGAIVEIDNIISEN
ncbi:MAG: hypothetical protein DA407_01795 [Bacteroidetes bacterium]|nr:MAG: hypothetical protein DA407_01795 [Bacteroidota bacterium]